MNLNFSIIFDIYLDVVIYRDIGFRTTGCPKKKGDPRLMGYTGHQKWTKHKSWDFLYSLERKFPEFCKTHPTFVISPLLVPFMAR